MKKVLLLVVGCWLMVGGARAQWVAIPDTNFGKWMNANGLPSCLQGNSAVGWQLDTTCPTLRYFTHALCFNKNIRDLTGIQYFDSLIELDCNDNQLSSLPPLPKGLIWLNCYNNWLSSLPTLPDSLLLLQCGNNRLDSLPALPSRLDKLSCYLNNLTSLPALPNSLKWLYCYENLLSSLPGLPNGLLDLVCNTNHLTSLPPIPNSLTIRLTCFSNQLNNLPNLPNGLTTLYCGYNLLSSLPPLPDSLAYLSCGSNQIQCIPFLPKKVNHLLCEGNQLTGLPELPDSLFQCYVRDNPILNLPQLKRIVNLNFVNTDVACVPNLGNVTTSYPALNTLPLCDSIVSNPCPTIVVSEIHILQSDFRISPNPATNTVTISLDEGMIGGTATLSDITGRKMAAVKLTTDHGQLTTENFSNGVYFVTVTDSEGRSGTKKLIIQK